MTYRFVAIDIDHTLLNEAGHISPRVRQAIATAITQGVHVTLATGRRLFSARLVATELGLKLPIILYHGALVYDTARETVLQSHPLPEALAGRIVDAVRSYGLQPFLYQNPSHDPGEYVYTGPEADDDPETEPYRLWVGGRLRRLDYSLLGHLPQPLAIGVIGGSEAICALHERLCGALACYTVLTPYMDDVERKTLDIIHPAYTKAITLELLAAEYGIPIREVMAIGDGINDREMIEAAGMGVAVGNAVPEVQASADAIVATNDEDGVAEAIERWVLQ